MGQSIPINTGTILIVEDEAIIRFELVDFFEDAGFRVLEADNADRAIAILERESTVRIVLTDVQMPGSIDGLRLAHFIRKRYPPTLLLVMSGAEPIAPADLPDRSAFVPKPFDPRRVLRQIEQLTR